MHEILIIRVKCGAFRGCIWADLGFRLRAIQSLYAHSERRVRVLRSKSDLFQVGVAPILSVIYMDRISRRSRGVEGLQVSDLQNSTSKSEATVLSREPMDCLLRVGNESLPQLKELEYLRVLLMSEGMMGRDGDWPESRSNRCSVACASPRCFDEKGDGRQSSRSIG